ncbi:ATP-binding cassette domain-containing protein [Allomuricauda sp.]|jgi:ABC-type bacteriocin/lantibiotic exporter with double-glycine peptidase domain|uniref:peptidase domain-containing ABC transporter n=1 Tax=Flagellimonas sp. TaxID=2058762 RepID=UPI001B03FE00|nr:ATP-binding cassette domain-containing protein [Allomuricauda sp.]MBO6531502.1 ATP-binding cassette domain-containing protein [Allomuricauda sp.]MBO6587723.1 ATP-binding cassette domain-containing protein [Allomuricauda sp.]MBO6617348.1 ATP-binding cassette domain-containing protein [Allomuricauda sp.]MBO6643641.1 ATP-binding cassette domain-containing protein [Allomuricauda sp.]MBO6745683.1 ATP-binding cassette domain-containing protein [Allomuricauda sp.]
MAKQILTSWQRLVNLLKLDRKDVLQVFYYAIFSGLVGLSLPLGIQAIINLIQGAQVSTSWIILVILVTLGVAFSGVLQLMQIRIIENIQQKIFTRSSFEFTYRFPKIKMSELRNYYPPELANRFFDTLNIQKGVSKLLIDFPTALLQIVFGLLLLSLYHPFFIVYGVLLLGLIYVVFKYTISRGLETSLAESKQKYKVAHWIQEVARSIVSFKLSGKTSHALQKNDYLVSGYLEARESHFRILVLQFIQMIGFKILVTAGLLIIGGLLVLNQEMNIGQFVAAEIIILLVISSVEKLIVGLESFYDVLTALEKLGQVVDKEVETDQKDLELFEQEDFKMDLENIVYNVPKTDINILNGLSMSIEKKDRILITGANGSGKSTLLHLISGLIEPTRGSIYVNGVRLKSENLNHFRSKIGQSLKLETPFEGTLKENITFGNPEITKEDILWVLDVTGLSKVVKDMEDGIDTVIFPEGKQISYTVAKKIVLARSLVKRPKLLVLRDPLDQFDEDETTRIMDFLTDPAQPWSLVVVSDDKKWVNKCGRILTIENGTIKQ